MVRVSKIWDCAWSPPSRRAQGIREAAHPSLHAVHQSRSRRARREHLASPRYSTVPHTLRAITQTETDASPYLQPPNSSDRISATGSRPSRSSCTPRPPATRSPAGSSSPTRSSSSDSSLRRPAPRTNSSSSTRPSRPTLPATGPPLATRRAVHSLASTSSTCATG